MGAGAAIRSPYQDLPDWAFWRAAMLDPGDDAIAHLYQPKVALSPETRLMTAGSCFAQHMHRALSGAGWQVLQGEDMTDLLSTDLRKRYGYNIYSARYGNLYTARQLLQLVQDALADTPRPALVWERDGRYFDALRPSVEPGGLDHPDHVQTARRQHLAAVRDVLTQAQVIIFTLGLTECWVDRATGLALPTAPGTIAGSFDADTVEFHNFTYPQVLADLTATRDLLRAHGLPARFLLTVSPVPLTATASGAHVGAATTYSKSVLRAVCGELQGSDADFDYFPSFEIITTRAVGGPYFAENQRQPSPQGIEAVLAVFSMAHAAESAGDIAPAGKPARTTATPAATPMTEEEVACEEILIEAFRK